MGILKRIKEDIRTVFKNDPAARNTLEVITCYPGLHAIWIYRLSHFFWNHRLKWLGRFISHIGRFLTGVDIHPGAEIGRRLFIDHGTGVVIGQTSEIGDDVLMYQGTTLGGTSREKGKRHPTVENRVVIGADATLLGPIKIGEDAKVGAGSVVLDSVPSNASVVGIPAKPVEEVKEEKEVDLDHADLTDPIEEEMQNIKERLSKVEEDIQVVDEEN